LIAESTIKVCIEFQSLFRIFIVVGCVIVVKQKSTKSKINNKKKNNIQQLPASCFGGNQGAAILRASNASQSTLLNHL
jgi:hypothetical protein